MADEGFKRKLTAILSADVEGYSRLMGEDEEATVRTLTSYREVLSTLIQQHNGKVLDSPGDNLLAEFVSVVDAVQCAVAVQKEINARNTELPENRRMQFRIGINIGDVIQEEGRIYGDGVNIAARLEGLAEPGGICISKTAFDHIESKLPYGYDFIGDQTVKNIAKPVGAYRVLLDPRVTVSGKPVHKKSSPIRRMPVLVGVVILFVLALAAAIWQFYAHRPTIEPASEDKMAYPLPDKPSIAVLPFVNLSGDAKREYFADAISENITTELSGFDHLFVIARQSAFAYKGSKKKINQISQELGVRYLLEGSVQRSDNQVRIIAQLIDAVSGEHVWTEKFDRNLSNIFTIQDEITLTVVNTLSEKIWQISAKTLSKKPLSNFKAWDYILRGRAHYRMHDKQENATARALFEKALELDPELSLAYIWLAWTHYMDWRFWGSDLEAIDKVEDLTNKAAVLGENKADIQYLLSRIALGRKRYDAALAHMERALTLKPNDAEFIFNYGTLLMYAGRAEESIPWFKKAMRINPYHPDGWVYLLAGGYYLTQRYGEVVEAIVSKARVHTGDHVLLAASYAKMGLMDKAQAHAKEILKINPEFKLSEFRTYLQRLYKNETDIEHFIDGLRKAGLPEHPPLKLPDKPSIAVLPFDNMSDDPKQEYFSDGITENIIMALSKTPKLFVIARNSTFAYKNKPVDIKQAAEDLGVRYILEGSVQKTENRVRVTAQLIDATTGRHQWAERYDRELKDIFALQDEITLEIIMALQVELTEGEQSRIHRGGTNNLEAFLKILKGREHEFRYTKEDMKIAKRLYTEAIDLDPRYATAYFWLASAIDEDLGNRWSKSREKDIERLFELSEKIFALDESNPQAHMVLSRYYYYTGQQDKAITEAEKAVDLDPNNAEGHASVGIALAQAKRFKGAIPWFKKAIRRNPNPPNVYLLWLGVSYMNTGSYEEAIAAFEKRISLAPTRYGNYMLIAISLSIMRRHEAAIEMAEKAFNLGSQESQQAHNTLLSHLAEYYRRAGRFEEAIDASRKLLDSNPSDMHKMRAYITMTCAYSALGNDKNARAAAVDILRIRPDFSLATETKKHEWLGLSILDWFWEHESDKNLLMNTLRKAGLK
jgi:adenylate cyclase